MPDEGVELGDAVAQRAVAENGPDLGAGPAKRRAERKTAANAERAEGARVEPAKRPARPQDVGGRADEIAAIRDEYGVIGGCGIDGLQ